MGCGSDGILDSGVALGFGNASSDFDVTNGNTFTLNSNTAYFIFPMPFDGKVTAIFGRFSTVSLWTFTGEVKLFLAVATAPAGENVFTIDTANKAIADPYPRGAPAVPNRTIRDAKKENISIEVKQGEYLALVAGIETAVGTLRQSLPFTYTGSIVIEKK